MTMTVEKFWNAAFLAALSRLPADEAKLEADRATELCIEHWHEYRRNYEPSYLMRWKDQDITKASSIDTCF